MRIVIKHGRKLVCNHFYPVSEILPMQEWAPASGNNLVVTITKVEGDDVTYQWLEKGEIRTNTKDQFAFQCRYCRVIE